MGLFSKPPPADIKCKLCGKIVDPEKGAPEIELCYACATILDMDFKSFQDVISINQTLCNDDPDPDGKIFHLRLILDALYEHKITYWDNDVRMLKQDINELIDAIIDAISHARL